MLRSSLALAVSGLVLLGSVFVAYSMGAGVHLEGARHAQPAFVLANSEVRFEPADAELSSIDEIVSRDGDAPARGGAFGSFVYQGVLADLGGQPVVGPVSLEFLVYGDPVGGGARIPLSGNLFTGIMPDAVGRFQVEVGLPIVSIMNGHTNFGLQISDETGTVPIGPEVPIRPAPYAWLSEHARSSDTAEFADAAGAAQTAVSADTADALTNDQSHTIVLSDQFSPSAIGGRAPYATRVGNMVFLSGSMRNDFENPNGSIVGTLPLGMRPSSSEILAVHVALSSPSGNAAIIVSSSGQISVISSNYSAGSTFFLNGAYFMVD